MWFINSQITTVLPFCKINISHITYHASPTNPLLSSMKENEKWTFSLASKRGPSLQQS